MQLLVPYTALGTEDPSSAGSLALTVFTTSGSSGDGIRQSVPPQPGSLLNRPAFVSDMLMPLYPFDTPLSNPIIYYDMPAMRWRMPMFDSVDGYQVQVARDARFTQLVETWESYETQVWPFFALLPASFQSKNAYEDNESYYWRVRIRHERYVFTPSDVLRLRAVVTADALQAGQPPGGEPDAFHRRTGVGHADLHMGSGRRRGGL